MNEINQTISAQQNNIGSCFTSSRREGICALLSVIPAYFYAYCLLWDRYYWQVLVVSGFLILITELLHSDVKHSGESFVWIGCFALCNVSYVFSRTGVWNHDQCFLFLHIFAVWWMLSRSGKLLEGESGHLLPADALNGFIRVPFGNYFLRVRSIAYNIRHSVRAKKQEGKKTSPWVIPAVLVCAVLFLIAVRQLMDADAAFESLLDRFVFDMDIVIDLDTAIAIIFSLPVGAWLFGLMGGLKRTGEEKLSEQRRGIYAFLERIRSIPVGFWIAAVGLFSLVYLAFFAMQGSYLFGAFTRTLPEGFIVSEYARTGFFELCRVMAVNFAVLWLVTRMCEAQGEKRRILNILCLIVLCESMLFAVIALSKLWLYISCFGFTPKRLQSVWLICVLFAGCVLWGFTILTDKPVFRKWMYFGAVSLSILTLI